MRIISLSTPAGAMAARLWDAAGPGAPWLHFGHATGMHGGLYASRLAGLADRFNILASDVRGHGLTARLGNHAALASWADLACDLLTILDQVDPTAPWLLAGHSLGGMVATLAAAMQPARVSRLVLIEPAIMPFALARAGGPARNGMAERAAARRPAFPDAASARRAWEGRGVFAHWADGDLDAYVADALLPGTPSRLACTPAFEAMTFEAWPRDFEARLAQVATPFTLLAAERESTVAPDEFALLARHRSCLHAARVAGADHFLPLSHWPDVATALLAPEPISMASAAS